MNYDTFLHGLYSLNQLPSTTPTYTRPSDWLPLPEVQEGEQKIVALFAIFDDVTISGFQSYCNISINWGDGSAVENINAYSNASHSYSYSSLPSNSYCSRGYKQVIITITALPNNTITYLQFPSLYKKALDINISGSSINSFRHFNGSLLERFNFVGSNNITSASNFTFSGCHSLSLIQSLDTSKFTSFSYFFENCYNLKTIPLLNTSSGTNFSSMFYNCLSLVSLPLLNTSSGTLFYSMFFSCYSLITIPALNTSSGTNFGNMFENCYSLKSIPLLNTSSGTNFSSMFYNCYNLSYVPSLDTSNATTASSIFYNCFNIIYLDSFSLSNVTSISSIFFNCYRLQYVNSLITTNISNFTNSFNNCYNLSYVNISYINSSISFSNCNLNKTIIINIFNNLASGVTGKTITISGNPGASLLTQTDRDIAINKGWTISG